MVLCEIREAGLAAASDRADGRRDARALFDCFAHQVDHEIQDELVSGLMTRYAAVSRQLKRHNERLEELVREKVAEVSSAQMATIYALVRLAESRDDDTGEHIGRTSAYCRLIAIKFKEAGAHREPIGDAFVENIAQASPLHDIGKVGIPDAILLKPARLTPEEFEVMKTHVLIGHRTLASVEKSYPMNAFIRMGMDIALRHHERWDGSGYPDGLSGMDIPLAARIMALADVYDALRSSRVYKPGYSHEDSAALIRKSRGTHLDPLLVDIFEANQRAFCDIFERGAEG